MLMHPSIDPVALQIGPLAIHWYGLTYLAAFGLFFLLARQRLKHQPYAAIRTPAPWSVRDVEDLLFLGVMGVVIGGRLGYCLFYKPAYYVAHPLEILALWQGGMSFHGGLLGVLVSQWWFARSRGRPWLQVMDLIAPCVFPGAGPAPRHPSQIYQFLLEGLLLFVLLWLLARRPQPQGRVSAAFLIGYGLFRFIAEYYRQPDDHLGLLSLGLSMGQWLCLPMVGAGLALWVWSGRQRAASQGH